MQKVIQKRSGRRVRSDKMGWGWLNWRFWSVVALLGVALTGGLWRAAYLQVLHPERLVHESNMRSLRVKSDPVVRGMVTDRTGSPLAVSVPSGAVWADAQEILQRGSMAMQGSWQALAEVLGLSPVTIGSRIRANPKGRFIYLARQISPEVAHYIRELAIPGVFVSEESRRFYPAGEVAAHVVGLTDIDGIGIEGLEKSSNHLLRGESVRRVVRKDGRGQIVEDLLSVGQGSARDLMLTIDDRLQLLAYRELKLAVEQHKALSGSAVLVHIKSGEVLALVNSPSYNPNSRAQKSLDRLRNRAVTDIFEPGSTVKPLVLLKALQEHKINLASVIDTSPGTLRLNGHLIRDLRNYGPLTLSGILQKSSNVAISKLSLALPVEGLVGLYRNFGLGISTDIGLLGESSGYILSKRRWSDLERATLAFGYGLAVTPLQLARAYATLGGFGIDRPLSIIRSDQTVEGRRVAPEGLVRQVVQLMEGVTLPGGGGVRAAVPGYRVAVKTGTARIAEGSGYSRNYISYTAGVAPVSDPELALVVVINNPKGGAYYGGAVAGPVFSAVMGGALRNMNVAPDKMDPFEQRFVNNWVGKEHAKK